MSDSIPTIIERAKLVAKDIVAMSETTQSSLYYNDKPHLSLYTPSKALLNLMDEPEIVSVLEYLQRQHYISFTVKPRNFGTGTDAYDIWPYISSLESLIKHEEPKPLKLDFQPAAMGVSFDKVRAVIAVNGIEVLLGRTEGSKSLQYWVVYCTFIKPNKAVKELAILEKYDKENGELHRHSTMKLQLS